eukprot:gnl/Hemi2/8243_TR2842_c0_g1_i1.p1 gnl/Hemi2/8243_TR2842_c0_g1~~gnl/Hemi2/8243_TR2842_c0_g1_i1.p1  ORF type:complete len:331 (+),score=61.13 gnl/Hemi2/8243_TR2842_c0_g1_i1:184-1176(+)
MILSSSSSRLLLVGRLFSCRPSVSSTSASFCSSACASSSSSSSASAATSPSFFGSPSSPPPASLSSAAASPTSSKASLLSSADRLRVNQLLRQNKPELVIFDKDGTLICLHYMWGGWIERVASSIEASTKVPSRKVLELMGFDPLRRVVLSHGIMAATPMDVLQKSLVRLLVESGLSQEASLKAVAKSWTGPNPTDIKPLGDLSTLFRGLKARGLKVALATADDQEPTLVTMKALGLTQYIDFMACGNHNLPPKPSPDILYHVCKNLGTEPKRAVMVGDTLKDLLMGRAAKIGLNVGIFDVETVASLAPHCDLTVPSVDALLELDDLRLH